MCFRTPWSGTVSASGKLHLCHDRASLLRRLRCTHRRAVGARETQELPRWHRTPCIPERSRQVGEGDPLMGCNLVLNLTKSYVGHGANQAFIPGNNPCYRLVYYLSYQIQAFGLRWADNYKWILDLSFWKPLFFLSLFHLSLLELNFLVIL